MADRSVTYEFRAKFDSFRTSLGAGGRAVDDFGNKLTALDAKGRRARRGLTEMGDIGGRIALGAAGGLAAIVGVTANFEKAMSGVEAATREGAAGMDALRDAAIEAGAETAFSASEAAGGIEALGKAGVTTEEILAGGLTGALDLAAAGSLEVADAAEAAASAMAQFGLSGEDVPHIADLLAAAAGKAQGEVSDMAAALNQSGIIAAQTGLSIEETTGALAAFAEKGLLGSDAGTSFKTMLGALTPNSAKAAEAMDELGITAFDAQGNFAGLTEFADSLRAGMVNLTEEQRAAKLETIFGSDAVRAASIIYENGASGIQEWINKTDDAGYAAEQAAIKLDNLAGDFEALKGSIETALIGLGAGSTGPLREIVQGLTDTVNAFADLPGPAQNGVTAVLALTGALGGAVFIASRVVSGMASARAGLENMGMSAEGATRSVRIMSRAMGAASGLGLFAIGLSNANEKLGSFEAAAGGALAGFAVGGPWGAALGGAVGLFASLAHNAEDGTGAVEAFTAALDEQTGALTENNRQLAQKQLQDSGAFDAAEDLGISLALVTDAALGNAEAIEAVNEATAGYGAIVRSAGGSKGSFSAGYNEDAQSAATLQSAIGDVNDVVETSTEEFNQNKDASGDAALGIDNASGAAVVAAPRFEKMSEELKKSREAAHDTAEEFFNLGENLDKAKVSLSEWIKDLEDQADALRNFRLNAEEAARKGLDEGLIASLREAGTEGALRMRQLANATDEQIDRANDAWRRGQREVRKYTDDIGGVVEKANQLTAAILDIPLTRTVEVTFERHGISLDRLTGHATGGYISGPGTGTSDSIPAYVSRGEYVVRAAAVEKYGVAMFDRLNAMRFADGGFANRASASSGASGGVAASIDYDHLAAVMLRARPLYGDVHISGDPTTFKRELAADARRASLGGFS